MVSRTSIVCLIFTLAGLVLSAPVPDSAENGPEQASSGELSNDASNPTSAPLVGGPNANTDDNDEDDNSSSSEEEDSDSDSDSAADSDSEDDSQVSESDSNSEDESDESPETGSEESVTPDAGNVTPEKK
ncbi:hypothetical protein DPEC_G00286810 [Dallia pectoralis]|uniref:Uncharacterized protein n=1 Tax=Dallia pectoralis TaxID=75939 RepID=A0ACC2FK37_DALPE|nr:hypothetical protein DPEC_G00286810 [Dallia pectoralis]